MIGEGTQIALDMYRCLETVIQDPIQIETILKECMDRFSVKALHFYLDEDPDEGSLILYGSRKGWARHSASLRRIWLCWPRYHEHEWGLHS